MKKEYIPIYKIAGKIQYLTEVLPQIETNTILCKTLTGLGATYSEIKAKRHSVIIVPNGKHSASCVFFSPLFLPTFVASL